LNAVGHIKIKTLRRLNSKMDVTQGEAGNDSGNSKMVLPKFP